jgi:hypothetical protein
VRSNDETTEGASDGGILPFARGSLAGLLGVDGSLVAMVLSGAGRACGRCKVPIIRPEELLVLEFEPDESIVAFGILCESVSSADQELLSSALEARYAIASDGTLVGGAPAASDVVFKALILRLLARGEVPKSVEACSELLERISQGLAIFSGSGRGTPMRQIGSLSLHGHCAFCLGEAPVPPISHFRSNSDLIVCSECRGRGVPPGKCADCVSTGLASHIRGLRFRDVELSELPRLTANYLLTGPVPKPSPTSDRLLELVKAGFGDYPLGFLTEWLSTAEHERISGMVRRAVRDDRPIAAAFERNLESSLPWQSPPMERARELQSVVDGEIAEVWVETDATGALPKVRLPLSGNGVTFLVGPPSSGKSQIARDVVPSLFRRRQQDRHRCSFGRIGRLLSIAEPHTQEWALGMVTGLWPAAARQFAGLPESRRAGLTERSFVPALSELPCPECRAVFALDPCATCRGTGLDQSLLLLRSGGVEFGDWVTRPIERLSEARWLGGHELFVIQQLVRLGLQQARLIDPLAESALIVPEFFRLLRTVLELPVTGRSISRTSRKTLIIVDGLLDTIHGASHIQILRDVFDYVTDHGGCVLSASCGFPPAFHSCPGHVITLHPVSKQRTPAEMRDQLYPPHLSEVRVWIAN